MQTQITVPKNKYIPELDGLRGIAILMVLCYHYFPNSIICNFGWSGVDLFFVLSGFLISSRLIPFLDQQNIILKFYRNRFLRIVPLYFSFLIIFFLSWFLFTSAQTKQLTAFYQEHWWQFFIFIQNWIFIIDNPQSALHLNHLWSIAIEEQFYLIFPFLVFIIRKRKSLVIFGLSMLAFTIITRCIYYFWFLPSNEIDKLFWNTFFRLDALMLGLLLYLLFQSNYISSKLNNIIKSIAWSAIVFLLSGIIFYGSAKISNPFLLTLGFTLIALMYGFLMYSTILKRNVILNKITSNRFLRATGKISYGMYIIHWPIFLAGFSILHKLNINIGDSGILLLNAAICIPLTYGLSYFNFKYFESYFLSKKVKMQLTVNSN